MASETDFSALALIQGTLGRPPAGHVHWPTSREDCRAHGLGRTHGRLRTEASGAFQSHPPPTLDAEQRGAVSRGRGSGGRGGRRAPDTASLAGDAAHPSRRRPPFLHRRIGS